MSQDGTFDVLREALAKDLAWHEAHPRCGDALDDWEAGFCAGMRHVLNHWLPSVENFLAQHPEAAAPGAAFGAGASEPL